MNWKLSEIKIGNKFNPEFKVLENKPLVYKLLFPNNKVYIGQTKNIIKRIRSYIGTNNECRLISNAIKKYSKEDVRFTVLEFCKEEELNKKEEYYVSLYNSNNKSFGYNLTKGGDFDFKINPEITQNKIMASNTKKKVASYNLEGTLIKIYESISEAERDLNIHNSDIIRCCKCKNLRHRKSYMFSKDLEEYLSPYKREPVNIVKCFVFNKEGEFLSEHNSITNAAKQYNIPVNFARTYILQGSLINKSFYISYTKDFEIPINKRSKLINVFEVATNNKIDSIYGLKPCGLKYNIDHRTLHKYIHKNKEYKGLIFKYES